MRKCKYCGAELLKGAKFCEVCGKSINNNSRKIRGNALGIGLIVVFIVIGLSFLLINQKDYSSEFLISVEAGEEEEAREIYYKKIQNDTEIIEYLSSVVQEKAIDIVNRYCDGEISFENAGFLLERYSEFFPVIVDKALTEMDILNASQKNYKMGIEYFKKKDYLAAQDCFELVISEDANYADACQKIEECYVKYCEDLEKGIAIFEVREDFEEAIKLCDDARNNVIGEQREWLDDVRSVLVEKHVYQILNKINVHLEKRNIGMAEQLVNNALNTYPQNAMLEEKREIILEYTPVYLGKKFMVASDMKDERSAPYYREQSHYYDTSGNYYDSAQYYWTSSMYSDEDEIIYDTYDLNDEYTRLLAVLAPESAWKDLSSNKGTTFYIVADGKEFFSSYIDKNSEPIIIELDITGVKELKLGMRGGNNVRVLLAEPHIYKRY